jgi:transposase
MIQVNIQERDKKIFAKERYEHPHPRVNQRMDALHLKAKGLTNKEICDILGICNNTLLSYFKMYNTGGVKKLREINFRRQTSEMEKYLSQIKEYFIKNPPSSISEAAAKIKEVTGIERGETQVRKFLKHLGFRCLTVGVVPAKALTEEKKTNKKNIWTTNYLQD